MNDTSQGRKPGRLSVAIRVLAVLAMMGTVVIVHTSRAAVDDGDMPDAALPQPSWGPQPMMLAERYLEIPRTYLKWIWWPFLAYLFWGMAYVCDDYFVRTIEVISDRFKIPDDVAGATLMALGCNGPEMSLNTIAIFNPSDIGVGAVIGGEIFNVLVIIGTALLATPDMYMPLKISKFSFGRDIFFYVVSVLMLYFVLKDGYISRKESICLILGAVVYSTTVALSGKIRSCYYNMRRGMMRKALGRSTRPDDRPRLTSRSASIYQTVNNTRTDTPPVTPTSPGTQGWRDSADDDCDSDFDGDVDEDLLKVWDAAREATDPATGAVLKTRVEVRSAMMDRRNEAEERYVWLTSDAVMVSAAVDPEVPKRNRGRFPGMVYDAETKMWYHGGLINAPDLVDADAEGDATPFSRQLTPEKPLLMRKATTVPDRAGILGLKLIPVESIPLDDVRYCDRVLGDPNKFLIHVHQHGRRLGRLITVEFITKTPAVHDAWMDALMKALIDRRRAAVAAPSAGKSRSWGDNLQEWAEWLEFPIKFLTRVTIPDMNKPEVQKWYPLAFVMSMTWLAIFAFLVVSTCDLIHEDFGISTGLLGFTVAAAGTSFPNVFSGMVVSRNGKTTMALANALGANVQNVFLALAVPWTVQSWFINHGPIGMKVQDLQTQVAMIYITLLPVVLVYICHRGTMPKWSGGLFLVTYFVYLIVAVTQGASG